MTGTLSIRPLDGTEWEFLGYTEPPMFTLTDEQWAEASGQRTAVTYAPAGEMSLSTTALGVNRKVLRVLFGDHLPRSARSLRRRRANLRRKRRQRRKNRG